MAWPTLGELLVQLGINTAQEGIPADRLAILNRALAAAREQVEIDTVGFPAVEPAIYPPEDPPESLAAAALHLAVRVVKAPDAPFGIAAVFDSGGIYKARNDPDYVRLLKGYRFNVGIA
jgi:hypothetical protein